MDTNEGQRHEQGSRYGDDGKQSGRDARNSDQAGRCGKEQDGVGEHSPGLDADRAETEQTEKNGAEHDEKDDSENCRHQRRSISE